MHRILVLFVLAAALVAVGPAAAWTWPTDGPVLLSFSFDPTHPYAGGQHRGIDVGGDPGESVLAPASGIVTFAGTVPGSGRSVTILTSDGWSVTLTQLGSIAVAKGAAVAEGDGVGTIGPSGDAEVSGAYVQLGIRHADQDQGYVDPLSLLPDRGLPPPAAPAAQADPAAGEGASAPAATVPVDGQGASPAPSTAAVVAAAALAGPPTTSTVATTAATTTTATDVSTPAVGTPASSPAPQAPAASAAAPAAVAVPRPSRAAEQTPAPAVTSVAAVAPAVSAAAAAEPAAAAAPEAGSGDPVLPGRPASQARVTSQPGPPASPDVPAVAAPAAAEPANPTLHPPTPAPAAPAAPHPRAQHLRPRIFVDGAVASRPANPIARSAPSGTGRLRSRSTVALAAAATAGTGLSLGFRWLAVILPALALAALLVLGRRKVSAMPARMMAADVERTSEDPRSAGLAVCGGSSSPGPRGGLWRPVGRLRPLSPAEGERRPHGERHGRARHAGDGRRGSRRTLVR
jgi:hypothetical protein